MRERDAIRRFQYYVKTTHQLLPLKPDHLIVGLYLGNDFMDLIRHDDRPYLTRKANGEVEAHTPDFMMYEDPAREQGTFASIRTLSLRQAGAWSDAALSNAQSANALERRRQRAPHDF